MTRILILGGSGTVGRELIPALTLYPDLEIRALVRDPEKARLLRDQGVTPVAGDLEDPKTLTPAFEGVDRLWLLTAYGPRSPENSMNALHAARLAKVKHVVRLSAIGAAHDAPTRNGRLHALSDRELQESGIAWTIVRPHYYMQNLLGLVPSVRETGHLYQDMGRAKLGMVDAKDVGELGARLLAEPERHAGKIYTPTGPASIDFHRVASEFGRVLGRDVKYVPVSHDAAREAFLGFGASPWFADGFVEYGTAYSSGWGDFTNDHFPSVMGRPARSFGEFVERSLT